MSYTAMGYSDLGLSARRVMPRAARPTDTRRYTISFHSTGGTGFNSVVGYNAAKNLVARKRELVSYPAVMLIEQTNTGGGGVRLAQRCGRSMGRIILSSERMKKGRGDRDAKDLQPY
jgi:hypothetical protein